MEPITKKTQDAIDNLAKMNIACNQQNLVYYAQSGNAVVVNLLLDAGLNANYTYYLMENNKKTYYWPLFSAIANNHFEIAKVLIQNGAKINNRFEAIIEFTPLTYAIENENIEVLNFLVENGVDVNQGMDNSEYVPLIHAIRKNNFNFVEIIVNKNCKLNFTCTLSGSKFSPLSLAIEKSYIDIASFLITKNANVNYVCSDNGETPIFMAIRQNKIKVVELLINNKADINKKRTDGYTPLMLAYQKRYEEIIQLLIKNGANPLSEEEINKTRSFNPSINPEITQNIKKIWKKKPFKIGFWIVMGILSFLLMVKGCESCDSGSHSSSSSSSSGSSGSSNSGSHTCTYCGQKYSNNGYYHILDGCQQYDKDPGYDACCSSKCCSDDWAKNGSGRFH
ncbi:MAG: ankyrin repeat domain-containing protein [Bacteroidota bacterium]